MFWTSTFNTLTAILLGALIGVERQWRQHSAGLRTNTLVALGAALFVGLSLLFDREAGPTRIASQVVSGLEFLGGGRVILREGLNLSSLNPVPTQVEAVVAPANLYQRNTIRPPGRFVDELGTLRST